MPILQRVKAIITAADPDNPSITEESYIFVSTAGLYVGDISTATGIISPNAEGNFDDDLVNKVVQLIRSGNIVTGVKPEKLSPCAKSKSEK